MALCKFKTKSGKTYYYNNSDNTVTDGSNVIDFNIPFLNDTVINQYKQFHEHTSRKRSKSNTPFAIRLSLGQACNYSCVYCSQKEIGNPEERPVRKGAVDSFINSVESFIDTSKLQSIELWGGEPLLYWNDIVKIIQYFDNKNITFLITTNGSLLNQKHVDFFSSIKSSVRVVLSHDANYQRIQRGEDVFEKASVCNAVQAIDSMYPRVTFQTNTVITKNNIDFLDINNFFKNIFKQLNLKNAALGFELGRAFEVKNWNESLVIQDEHLDVLRKNLNTYFKMHIEQLSGVDHGLIKVDLFEHEYFHFGVGGLARSIAVRDPLAQSTTCGADNTEVLSMDIFGNIKLCPHTGSDYNYGSVSNLKGVRILSIDTNRAETHCKDCHNLRICKSSCPITLNKEVFYKNCAVEKIWHGEMLKAALRLLLNEEVEFLNE